MDPSGAKWLSHLLRLAPENTTQTGKWAAKSGTLFPKLINKRPYKDRILQEYGIDEILLEECFEKSVPPPQSFLRWLISHSNEMVWADSKTRSLSREPRRQREQLFGKHGSIAAQQAQVQALQELDRLGSEGSRRQWWAFEGFTEVDCYLETECFLLFIEGKRTESFSPSTFWYPQRHQLVRNLEVAKEAAGEKPYGVMVIAENLVEPVSDSTVKQSLPHFLEASDRKDLMSHYLGCVLWEDVCKATGLDHKTLPQTTSEVVSQFA